MKSTDCTCVSLCFQRMVLKKLPAGSYCAYCKRAVAKCQLSSTVWQASTLPTEPHPSSHVHRGLQQWSAGPGPTPNHTVRPVARTLDSYKREASSSGFLELTQSLFQSSWGQGLHCLATNECEVCFPLAQILVTHHWFPRFS